MIFNVKKINGCLTESLRKSGFCDYIGILFLFYLLVYFGHGGYGNYITIVAALLLFSAVGLRLIFGLTESTKLTFRFKQFYFFLWYVAFFSYVFASLFWSADFNIAFYTIRNVLHSALLLLAVVCYIDSEQKYLRFIKFYLAALFYTVLRLLMYAPTTLFNAHYNDYTMDLMRLNNNTLAANLVFGILAAFFLYNKTKNKLYVILISLFYYVILMTNSRQGVVMPIFGLFIFIGLKNGFSKMYKTIILLIIIILLFITYLNSNMVGAQRIRVLVNGFVYGTTPDNSFNDRMYFIGEAANMFEQKPIFGHGAGGFGIYIDKYGTSPNQHLYTNLTYAHNNYLELLSGLGIIGFLLYYSAYLKVFMSALKESLKSKNIYAIFATTIISVFIVYEYGRVTYCYWYYIVFIYLAYYPMKICKQNINIIRKDELNESKGKLYN